MLTSLEVEEEQRLVPVDELLVDFEKALIDTLKAPEKNVIGNLTGMVEGFLGHKDSTAICSSVCRIIERRLNEVQVGRKLAHLYLMDSIIKNLKTSQYPKLFGANLVATFSGVFRKGDEKMRKKLFELRKTWPEHFAPALLHSLDLVVKEIDPAWPLLAAPTVAAQQPQQPPTEKKDSPPDKNAGTSAAAAAAAAAAARKRGHPPDSPDSTTASSTSGGGVKRPSLQAASAAGGDFVIDTVGDPKVEAMAAKAGRHQYEQQPGTSDSDVDMRRSWSQYRRSLSNAVGGDIDMRQFQTTDGSQSVEVVPEMIAQQQAQIKRMLAAPNLKSETRQQLLGCLRTLESELQNVQQQQQQQTSSQIPQHVDNLLDALLGGQEPAAEFEPQQPPLHHQQHHQPPLPQQQPRYKDLFRWRVMIPGMPEFPQIGCDPRLLMPLRDRLEATRNIQIDGEMRQVVLDRIQPLLIMDDQPHALRFKMPPGGRILLRVDAHQPMELSINSWTKVFFGLRPCIVCLGGPFHELIVHGRPYNVPFNDANPVYINLGGGGSGSFGVRLQALMPNSNRAVTPSLDICPAIPRSVLRWANESAFGNPAQLHRPPLNPEYHQHQHPHQHIEDSHPAYQQPQPPTQMPSSVPLASTASDPQLSHSQLPPPHSNANTNPQLPPHQQQQQQQSSVFEMFQNLIRHGIIKKTKPEDAPEPDLTAFDAEITKPLPMIPKRLYDGYQCSQCGLRFPDQLSADCRSHLDWHYQRRAAQFGQTIRSRMWFPHWTALVKGETDAAAEAAATAAAAAIVAAAAAAEASAAAATSGKKDHHHRHHQHQVQHQQQNQLSRVPAYAEPGRNVCGVCFETFENRWDDDAEDWMLQDCVRLPDGGIYHPICAEDAGKVKLEEEDDAGDRNEDTPAESLPQDGGGEDAAAEELKEEVEETAADPKPSLSPQPPVEVKPEIPDEAPQDPAVESPKTEATTEAVEPEPATIAMTE